MDSFYKKKPYQTGNSFDLSDASAAFAVLEPDPKLYKVEKLFSSLEEQGKSNQKYF